MTHNERVKEKHRMKMLYITAYSIAALCFIALITLFKLAGDEAVNDFQIVLISIVGILLPAFAALIFGMYGGMVHRKLMSEFTRLYDLKNKRYFRRFYEAVLANDLELARKRFNIIAVRTDTYKIFAHGILITLMRMSGDDKNVRKAEERMSDILNS